MREKKIRETRLRYGSKTKTRVMSTVIVFVLIVCSVIMLTPVVIMITTALKTQTEIFQIPPRLFPSIPQFSNYVKIFTDLNYFHYFLNSLFIAVFVVVGTLISSSLVAFGFFRYKTKGSGVLFLIVIATLMIPYPAVMIPEYILFNKLRWVNTYLPLIVPAFFGSAYMIFLLRQFFSTISNELFDAARIDGCGEFRCYWNIAVPLSKTALAVVAIFSFLWNWDDLLSPVIYLSDQKLFTLPVFLSGLGSRYRIPPWNLNMAAATITVLPAIILFIFCQKYFVEGIVTTGIKG
ncbi:MAG: carbohydrate ABC transporter permease [Firmicutes bacterium]|nr:carbohydrate ABC transporter permease [Bacillota bacterium]